MRAALPLLLGGCSSVFGLGKLPDVDADTSGPTIAGTIERVVVTNETGAHPAIGRDHYASSEMQVVTIDPVTAAETQIAYDPLTGAFSAPSVVGGPTRIQLRVGARIFEYQWTKHVLVADLVHYGRTDAVPATVGTSLSGALSVPQSNTVFVNVYVTGIFEGFTTMFNPSNPTTYRAEWNGALASSSAFDQMFWVGYTTDAMQNQVITEAYTQQLDMTQGSNIFNVPLAPITTPPSCAHVIGAPTADAARISALFRNLPAATGGVAVFGNPAPELGPDLNWLIARTPTTATTDTLMSNYVDVFPGFTTLVGAFAGTTRKLPNGDNFVNTSFVLDATDGTCTTTSVLGPTDIVVAHEFVLGATPLDADGTSVALTAATVQLTWATSGRADLYQVEIDDVTNPGGSASHVIRTTEPSAILDAAELRKGRTFMFVVRAYSGLPDADSGDLTHHTLPAAIGVGASSTFAIE